MNAYIVDAVRTPIGRFGGHFSLVRADDLGAAPIRALLSRNYGWIGPASTMSYLVVRTKPAKTIEMLQEWRPFSPVFPKAYREQLLIDFAVLGWMPSAQ